MRNPGYGVIVMGECRLTRQAPLVQRTRDSDPSASPMIDWQCRVCLSSGLSAEDADGADSATRVHAKVVGEADGRILPLPWPRFTLHPGAVSS